MISRRMVFAGIAAAPLAGAALARAEERKLAVTTGNVGPRPKFAPRVSGREMVRNRYFPNVELVTSDGEKVRFYDDLLKDKIVILNLM